MERPEYLKEMEEQVEEMLAALKIEKEEKERKRLISEIMQFSERLQTREESEMEFLDKTKRREMEEVKNQELLKVEKKKLHMPPERIVLAVGEIVLPIIFASALVPYMAKFESEGRVCSSIGREIWNLPKMFIRKYR